MNQPWAAVFLVLAGAWVVALAAGIVAVRLVLRRRGREGAWPALHVGLPLLDLVGTWAGALGAAALLLGRTGYTAAWAGALFLVALMVTASLYDRAVLMPSLDAAFKRLGLGAEAAKWEADWRFLWRMAAWGRGLTLAMGVGALACVLTAMRA